MSHAAMTVLLCRFHKTKEVRETVRIQLLMSPPPQKKKKAAAEEKGDFSVLELSLTASQ